MSSPNLAALAHASEFLTHERSSNHQHFDTSNIRQSTTALISEPFYDESSLITHALALLQPTTTEAHHYCMNNTLNQPDLQSSTRTRFFLPPRQDSVISAESMYAAQQTSMPLAATRRPLKRARAHERTPSASTTISTNGPLSPAPYSGTTTSYPHHHPHIANTEFSPDSPAHSHYADQAALFSKALPTPQVTPTDTAFVSAGYIPSAVAAHMPNARLAMNGFPIDHFSEDFPPDFAQSSRQSMSSGHDSPATPQSHAGDHYDPRGSMSVAQPDYRQANSHVQLYRSDSQAYQDELFNPVTFGNASASAKRTPDSYLSPHRNLVTERLQTANLARSASPTSAMSRERSPFRDGSPLAPVTDWSSGGQVRTAAGMRQQQKEESAQAEYAQHVPNLQREPTKTISPKDALLEYHETADQPPLFQDSIPQGYRQHNGHNGRSDAWQSAFVTQPGSTFGQITASAFHATPTPPDAVWSEANFSQSFLPPTAHQHEHQIQGPFHNHAYAAPRMDYSDPTPEFPAQLTSMESSISEGGPPLSSQSSFHTSMPMQRPADTRANTGTYTCTYHGCTERFETHLGLQKHKRDYHRSQQHKENVSTPSGTDSASPRSTESPAPSGSGMTSAAILARNSQAGPHKCTRINPSTNKPCNVIFSRPYDLTRHEDTIHNNRKQKVRCPMCREEKTFSRNDALTRHMRVVHPEVESYGKRSRRGD